MKNKLLKAIQKALCEVLSTDISDDNISWDFNPDISDDLDKIISPGTWWCTDMHKALSHALFVNDMDLLFNDKYEIKLIKDSLDTKESTYDDCPVIHFENIDIMDMTTILTDRGWKFFNVRPGTKTVLPEIYFDNIRLINNIYDDVFINDRLHGLYFSYDNSMVALYYKDGIQNVLDFTMSGNISKSVFKEVSKNAVPVEESKKQPIMKALSSIKLQPKKFGFMPKLDDEGNLYYETYLICSEKKQSDEFKKLYTKINTQSAKLGIHAENNIWEPNQKNVNVKYYKDLPNGSKLCIYQFEEDLHDGLHRYGWRIDLQ